MAINARILEPLLQLIRQLPRPCRLVALGYPDMLVTPEQLKQLCGELPPDGLAYREDSDAILRWHKLEGEMPAVAETASFFRLFGVEFDCIDIAASRGMEIVADLNAPLPHSLCGRYDVVYDGGTMEHCFNVGQVMRNITALARVGGFIAHVNPLNYYNHGFFAFNPTFYHDYYSQNGHRLASPFYGLHGPVLDSQAVVLPATQGFRSLPERCALMVVAQRCNERAGVWPMQHKYLANPELKG